MTSPWIAGLRSVGFDVPDLAKAEKFYSSVWHLEVAARTRNSVVMRGVGGDHHLLELHAHPSSARMRRLTLRATDRAALAVIVGNAVANESGLGQRAIAKECRRVFVRSKDDQARVFRIGCDVGR